MLLMPQQQPQPQPQPQPQTRHMQASAPLGASSLEADLRRMLNLDGR
jgi:hypothetical protein